MRCPCLQTKVRCWLFFSYIVAFSAVGGGVAVLITCVNKQQHLAIGIVRGHRLCFPSLNPEP